MLSHQCPLEQKLVQDRPAVTARAGGTLSGIYTDGDNTINHSQTGPSSTPVAAAEPAAQSGRKSEEKAVGASAVPVQSAHRILLVQ